jgi:hypothetical protein
MPDLDVQIRELIAGVEPVTAAEVIAAHESLTSGTVGVARYRRPRHMRSYAIGAGAMAAAICVLVVVLVVGVSSSKPTVVTPRRPLGVPASWQKVTFGGLTMYAPGNWPATSEQAWGDCSAAGQPLFKDSSVVLDAGSTTVTFHCPNSASKSSIPPAYGLIIDPGKYGPLKDVVPIDPGFDPGFTGFNKCLKINRLSVCPTSFNFGGILVVAVHIPGITRPVAVEIGLAGGGKVAHTILYSMHPSAPAPHATTNAAVRPCADGVLTITVGRPGDQAQMLGSSGVEASLEVLNTGPSVCTVTGTPRYFMRTASGSLVELPHYVLRNGDGGVPRALPVVLTGTHSSTHNHGYVTFLFFESTSDQCLDPGTLMVEVPGQSTLAAVPNADGGPALQTCSVSTIEVRPVSSTDYLAGLVHPSS